MVKCLYTTELIDDILYTSEYFPLYIRTDTQAHIHTDRQTDRETDMYGEIDR